MVDKVSEILSQYDIIPHTIKKGRGQWIIECADGIYTMQECSSWKDKIAIQHELTQQIKRVTGIVVQEIVCTKEHELVATDGNEGNYLLQTYENGRECNIKDEKDWGQAISILAKMHKGMYFEITNEKTDLVKFNLLQDFAKRNKELRRIRRYLREKKQKNEFERALYQCFDVFFNQAIEVEEEWKHYEHLIANQNGYLWLSHGDFQHHNVWIGKNQVMILHFEKILIDLPCRDLYLFMRKLLEKVDWDSNLGFRILQIYEKERALSVVEKLSLFYRLSYPEKFWKVANYYYNSKKSFVPSKNMEKLVKLTQLEEKKQVFLGKYIDKFIEKN